MPGGVRMGFAMRAQIGKEAIRVRETACRGKPATNTGHALRSDQFWLRLGGVRGRTGGAARTRRVRERVAARGRLDRARRRRGNMSLDRRICDPRFRGRRPSKALVGLWLPGAEPNRNPADRPGRAEAFRRRLCWRHAFGGGAAAAAAGWFGERGGAFHCQGDPWHRFSCEQGFSIFVRYSSKEQSGTRENP